PEVITTHLWGAVHPLGPACQRLVHPPDVVLVLMLGVVTAGGQHLALPGVVEVGETGVVELQIPAALVRDAPYLFGIRRGQIFPELFLVRIDVRIDRKSTRLN